MLKDINKNRPDVQLERNLIFLAYAIMLMSLSFFALFMYPQYSFYIVVSTVVWNIICILLTIRILKVSENAIGFGALSAEILNDKTKYYRIDNASGEPILINRVAAEYLQGASVVDFLSRNIIDTAANKLDLQKLTSAVKKLHAATVVLSVNPSQNSVYVGQEWLRVSVKPIFLSKTNIFEDDFSLRKVRKETYIFWTMENITAYKNMDQVFKDELSSLHSVIDYLPVGLYTCDNGGKLEYINNILAEKLRIDKNDAIGRKLDEFVACKAELLHTQSGNYDDTVLFKAGDDTQEAYVKQQNVREGSELKTRGIVIWNLPGDESLRDRLNILTDKFESLSETLPVGIIWIDKDSCFSSMNRFSEKLFARRSTDMQGSKLSAYFDEEVCRKVKDAFDDNNTDEICCDTILNINGEEKNLHLTMQPQRLRYSGKFGFPDGVIMYIQDTTNRRNLEMQVAQAQKMQAFGQLAGGVAHDFNNLLTAVVGYCDLLLRRHGIGDPSFSDLVELKNNVIRAIEVARSLLTISRKQPLNPKLIDATEAFTDNEHLISRVVGENIKVKVNFGSDLGYIRVDTVQFSQVLLNLAINARDAMNGKGTLTLSAHSERLSIPYQFGADTIKPGDFVVISVSDTGCGIPPENMERIFEPFFSTKKNILNSGTGLGLAMVYSIVRQMEGFLKVHSEVGKGTTFDIYLPYYENQEVQEVRTEEPREKVILDKSGKAAMKTIIPPSADAFGRKPVLGLNISEFDSQRTLSRNPGEIKILFVEDEDAVRIVGARGLRQKGYDVIDCISAENALEHIEAGEKFDMLITDMRMPGMSGAELAAIMHEKNPQTIIILASGYSEEIARKELAGSQDFYFIGKPYGLDDLNKKVKEVLVLQ